MSDITDFSEASAASNSEDNVSVRSEEELEDIGDIPTSFEPYQCEPLASSDDIQGVDNEEDIDGLPLERLEARFKNRKPVDEW